MSMPDFPTTQIGLGLYLCAPTAPYFVGRTMKPTRITMNATRVVGTPVAPNESETPRKGALVARSLSGRRFPLRLPIVFRTETDDRWRRATSTSISDTMVSFVSGRKLPVGARVQTRFVVRVSSARSEVECWTRITRVARPRDLGNPFRYTAAIESYRFVKVA